jgi:hypothetical protein
MCCAGGSVGTDGSASQGIAARGNTLYHTFGDGRKAVDRSGEPARSSYPLVHDQTQRLDPPLTNRPSPPPPQSPDYVQRAAPVAQPDKDRAVPLPTQHAGQEAQHEVPRRPAPVAAGSPSAARGSQQEPLASAPNPTGTLEATQPSGTDALKMLGKPSESTRSEEPAAIAPLGPAAQHSVDARGSAPAAAERQPEVGPATAPLEARPVQIRSGAGAAVPDSALVLSVDDAVRAFNLQRTGDLEAIELAPAEVRPERDYLAARRC